MVVIYQPLPGGCLFRQRLFLSLVSIPATQVRSLQARLDWPTPSHQALRASFPQPLRKSHLRQRPCAKPQIPLAKSPAAWQPMFSQCFPYRRARHSACAPCAASTRVLLPGVPKAQLPGPRLAEAEFRRFSGERGGGRLALALCCGTHRPRPAGEAGRGHPGGASG